jgi:hypothetical protein
MEFANTFFLPILCPSAVAFFAQRVSSPYLPNIVALKLNRHWRNNSTHLAARTNIRRRRTDTNLGAVTAIIFKSIEPKERTIAIQYIREWNGSKKNGMYKFASPFYCGIDIEPYSGAQKCNKN